MGSHILYPKKPPTGGKLGETTYFKTFFHVLQLFHPTLSQYDFANENWCILFS